MKKKILILMVGFLLIAVNLYADGDLIVNGKVGIGTNNPLQSLHVKGGTVRVDRAGNPSTVIINRTDRKAVSVAAGWDAGTFRFDNSGAFRIQAQPRADLIAGNGLNVVHLVNVDANGNVGIGTLSPQEKLDVEGNVEAYGFITGDITFQKDGTKLWKMFEDEEGLYIESLKTGKVYRFVLQEVEKK